MRQDEMIEILDRYRSELEDIISRFKSTRDGRHIEPKDHGRFTELVLELRDLFNDAFVDGHRHSNPLIRAYNDSVSNFYESPSYRGVEDVKGVVASALVRVQRNPAALKGSTEQSLNERGGHSGTVIKVFISHSSKDEGLARALINLIRSALPLPASDIRCTSVPGYKLPGGAETASQVRQELLAAPVFIGLVTEASLSSAYVLFELGARWGADRQLIPLMGPGISPQQLEGPISDINALSCKSASDLHMLIQQIAKALGISAGAAAGYQGELEIVSKFVEARAPKRPVSSVPQADVDALAELRSEAVHEILNHPVTTDAELAVLASYTEQWSQRVETILKQNFSRAEQLNFTRLGVVPDFRFPHAYNAAHAKILREYAVQERRLLDIIARHTR
jgi:hypothetical protein